RTGSVIEDDGVSGIARAVRGQGDLQGADLSVTGEAGDGVVQPSGGVVRRTARRRNGRSAKTGGRELHLRGNGRSAIQGLNGQPEREEAQRVVAVDRSGDRDVNRLARGNDTIARIEIDFRRNGRQRWRWQRGRDRGRVG